MTEGNPPAAGLGVKADAQDAAATVQDSRTR
jgi:hypothetical protein